MRKFKDIRELQEEIHENAKEKGFWEGENMGEKIALIHSELSEALEADREERHSNLHPGREAEVVMKSSELEFERYFLERVKDTFEDELADVVIRIMDLAARLSIDLFAHIELKHRYNKTRPYKHGKKY